jgi:NAD(P)-dependent dehydrogenase (short-subunit alcohol dehydrogenase family)
MVHGAQFLQGVKVAYSGMEIAQQFDLRGKVALVTGGARRVGKAIGLELAAQGMHIAIHHGSSDDDAAQTADEIRAWGVKALVVKADLRAPESFAGLFEAVQAEFGRLDVLVNNAATFKTGDLLSVTLDEWREVMDTNLTAPFLLGQHAVRLMRNSPECIGAIVNIIDRSAFTPWKTYPVHSVSKAALKSLTEVMALSYGPDVRVNAIAPGPVLRDEANSPEKWEKIGQGLPVKHTGHPNDVARAVAFLAAQPFITGATLQVDGGEGLL